MEGMKLFSQPIRLCVGVDIRVQYRVYFLTFDVLWVLHLSVSPWVAAICGPRHTLSVLWPVSDLHRNTDLSSHGDNRRWTRAPSILFVLFTSSRILEQDAAHHQIQDETGELVNLLF